MATKISHSLPAWTTSIADAMAETVSPAFGAIAYGSGGLVAVGVSTASPSQFAITTKVTDSDRVIISANDGATWSHARDPYPGTEDNAWSSVAHGGDVFVAVGQSGQERVMVSKDGGASWKRHLAEAGFEYVTAENEWTSVVHGSGTFVAVAAPNGSARSREYAQPVQPYTVLSLPYVT